MKQYWRVTKAARKKDDFKYLEVKPLWLISRKSLKSRPGPGGFTRCSVSYLLQPENILFAGDAAGVIETSGRIRPLFLSSYSQYERSLEKLAAVGAETLALPHNNAVKGEKRVAEFLTASLAETRRLKGKILDQLGKSDDFPRIAENLLELECVSPTVTGPREAQLINATAMVKSVFHEFVKQA